MIQNDSGSGWAAQKWETVVAVSRRMNECAKWSKKQQHLAECQKPQVTAQSLETSAGACCLTGLHSPMSKAGFGSGMGNNQLA